MTFFEELFKRKSYYSHFICNWRKVYGVHLFRLTAHVRADERKQNSEQRWLALCCFVVRAHIFSNKYEHCLRFERAFVPLENICIFYILPGIDLKDLRLSFPCKFHFISFCFVCILFLVSRVYFFGNRPSSICLSRHHRFLFSLDRIKWNTFRLSINWSTIYFNQLPKLIWYVCAPAQMNETFSHWHNDVWIDAQWYI